MRNRRLLVAGIASLVVLATVGVGGYWALRNVAATVQDSAILTIFVGTADVAHDGGTAFAPAKTGDTVKAGDTVRTGPDSTASIDYPGGSVIRLDAGTSLQVGSIGRVRPGQWDDSSSLTAGKAWVRIQKLVGLSHFRVGGPNRSTAEMRGTDVSIVIYQENGAAYVRYDTWTGLQDVSAHNSTLDLPAGKSTVVGPDQPPGSAGPIPAADRTDPFTIFNQAADASNGVEAGQGVKTLDPGQISPIQAGAKGDGNSDLDFTLNWPGSTFELIVYDPAGREYDRATSATPPLHLVVPRALAGGWSYRVHDLESKPAEVWAVVVGRTTPSVIPPSPFFIGDKTCDHTITAGLVDSWKVTARDGAELPKLTATGLPTFATFQDGGEGSASIIVAPPVTAGTADVKIEVAATAAGLTTVLECTEHVVAALVINDAVLVAGQVGLPYLWIFNFTGGRAPYSWQVTSGELAPGLSLDPTQGALSGVPTRTGSYTFTVTVRDALGNQDQKTYLLPISILAILDLGLPQGQVGVPYVFGFTASGGTLPYHWSLTSGSLPAGLTLGAVDGVINGTPTAAGTANFTIGVADANGNTAQHAYGLVVTVVSITTTHVPDGEVGVYYADGLQAAGGVPPYRWSVAAGSLPSGLSLDPSGGVISGTPTLSGAYGFTVQVADAAGHSFQQALSLRVTVLEITTDPLLVPNAQVGVIYAEPFLADGGRLPYSWSMLGNPPPGLTLDPAGGVVNGIPTTARPTAYVFTVIVTDAAGQSARQAYGVTVGLLGILTTPSSMAAPQIGVPYSQQLVAGGGGLPYSWSVVDGALPPGLSLDSVGGVISGDPSKGGGFRFTAQVVDASGNLARQNYLLIVATLHIDQTAIPDGELGAYYQAVLTAAGGTQPYGFSVTTGYLPPGLALDAAGGGIGGTPASLGSFGFTIQVRDANGSTALQQFVVTIARLLIVPAHPAGSGCPATLLCPAEVGQAYFDALEGSGGTAPYSFRAAPVTGNLPPGLALNSAGGISGTPTATGTFSFRVQVTDAAGVVAQKPYTITVSGLAISGYSLPDAQVDVPYTGFVVATGGTAPYSWSFFGSLDPGLFVEVLAPGDSVFVGGIPSTPGSYGLTLQVADASGAVAAFPATIRVVVVSVAGSFLPDAQYGVSYLGGFSVSGGNPAYAWSLATGALPPGLTLDSASGFVNGVPTAKGTYGFTIQVTESGGGAAQAPESITVYQLEVTDFYTPDGNLGADYFGAVVAVGGTLPYRWSIASGSLPAGLTLDPVSGFIGGVPTAYGNFPFLVRVTDAGGRTADLALSISIRGIVITATLPVGELGSAYTGFFDAAGGAPPYTWSPVSAGLPPGITFDPACSCLSGTPTATGFFGFTVVVTDSAGVSGRMVADLEVILLTILKDSSDGVVGVPYSTSANDFNSCECFVAQGGVAPYTWYWSGGSVPPGLGLFYGSATDTSFVVLDGTPTEAGFYTFWLWVIDANNVLDLVQVEVDVYKVLITSSAVLDDATEGAPYSFQHLAAGGTVPYTWSRLTGVLPGGLTLGSNGVLSGTPAVGTTGFYLFTVQATDQTGEFDAEYDFLAVLPRPGASAPLPGATVGVPYGQALASGPSPPKGKLTWSLVGGSLPKGLVLDGNGRLVGVATQAGTYEFTIRLENGKQQANVRYRLVVAAPAAPSPNPSPSSSPTPEPKPSPAPSATPSPSPSRSPSPSPSASPSPSTSPSHAPSPSPSGPPPPTASPSAPPAASPTPSPIASPSPASSPRPAPSPSP